MHKHCSEALTLYIVLNQFYTFHSLHSQDHIIQCPTYTYIYMLVMKVRITIRVGLILIHANSEIHRLLQYIHAHCV